MKYITEYPCYSTKGPVLSFVANFAITSGTTQITGTKTLASPTLSYGVCVVLDGQPFFAGTSVYGLTAAYGHDRYADVETTYQATITTAKQSYTDYGRTGAIVADMIACPDTSGCSLFGRFFSTEGFISALKHARPTH